jgi:hypothetical protein
MDHENQTGQTLSSMVLYYSGFQAFDAACRIEQRPTRQLIDVVQAFTGWRDASRKTMRGSLRWVARKGADYLYRKSGKSERSLGRRSPEPRPLADRGAEDRGNRHRLGRLAALYALCRSAHLRSA